MQMQGWPLFAVVGGTAYAVIGWEAVSDLGWVPYLVALGVTGPRSSAAKRWQPADGAVRYYSFAGDAREAAGA